MPSDLEHRCAALLAEIGVCAPTDIRCVEPLTGGVASDIAMIDLGDRKICAKFALAKLRVEEDWHAPVHRSRAEYAWLQVAAAVAPDSAVQLFGYSETQSGFAMDFIKGTDVFLWKTALLSGNVGSDEATRVGDVLGRIHRASTRPDFDTAPFRNRDDFHALRIEPYLRFTAQRHPDVAPELTRLADALFENDNALVHGDVSPKNILFRGGHPILLDAECATMGDPAFDVAFCLNHLVLKALHLPTIRPALLRAVAEMWTAYSAQVDWEPIDALEARICALLPALMLARVDGKSPVEYLTDQERAVVRSVSVAMLRDPPPTLRAVSERIATELKE